jgi:uncharacterized membrane protein YjgN (DUF898 family)
MSVTEAAVADAMRGAPSRPVAFIGTDKDYWRILVRGAFLLMVTLGLYRFWLATDIRRFLWAHTAIDGEPAEYSGTALELLQGFLVAIALLLPIYTLFLIAVLDIGVLGNLLSGFAVLVLAFLSQYGIYLARRYRLTRTVFRGLRLHQKGSAVRYAICAIWWWFLTIMTFGFAYPFNRAALERFKMRNTYYGDLQGRFEGSGWHLFARGFLLWLLVMVPILAALSSFALIDWGAALEAMPGGGDAFGRMEQASPGFLAAVGFGIIGLMSSLILALLLLPVFHAIVTRWWVSGLRFGDMTAVSHLRTRDVYAAYLRFVGYVLLFGLLLAIGIFIALFVIGLSAQTVTSETTEIITVLMMVGFYVVAALGLSTLYQAVVSLSVWRLTAQSTEISNTGRLAHVGAAGKASSPLGEGIADILNLGGI